jgi:uncharacterized protein YbbC (DUF1343 family)
MNHDYLPALDAVPGYAIPKSNRWGMLTNEAAKTNGGEASRLFLLKHGFQIVRLFSPEHGLSVRQADGESVGDQTDVLTGLPVVSLYGQRMKPLPEQLEGLDGIIFDIPDVGCRFYTYLWSMTYMMEACSEARIPLIILDRPNPIGGDLSLCEGPMLDEIHCSSFIGRWNIPVRHGCTLGELALFFQKTRLPQLELIVLPCKIPDRRKSFFETGTIFVPTSPAIQDAETALLYPGTGLLEGIQISEGRGTNRPFKQAGAPWIDAEKWKSDIKKSRAIGVEISEVQFMPQWGLFAGQTCYGLGFQVKDPSVFRPVSFGLLLIECLFRCFPDYIGERAYRTAANPDGSHHLDRLTGVHQSFLKLRTGEPLTTDCASWHDLIGPYRLYE